MTIRDDDFTTVRQYLPRSGGTAWAESNDALDRIEEAFTELRAQAQGGGWIAVGERMPEEGRAVLFSNPLWAEPELGRFVDDGWELDDETRYTQDEVQFWHALPAPPEVT